MEAVRTLETSTRLSKNCCAAFVEVGAPSILYELLGTCNRSLPHVEILHIVLLTLHNVSKHSNLLGRMATSKSGEVVLDLVQMFRDKEDIFLVALIILSRLVRNNKKLKDACSRSENMRRLTHVLRKVSPKDGDIRFVSAKGNASRRRQSVKILRGLITFLKD